MDYFKLFAYASFLFGIITLIGVPLYYLDLLIFPDDDDADLIPARHRKDGAAL